MVSRGRDANMRGGKSGEKERKRQLAKSRGREKKQENGAER